MSPATLSADAICHVHDWYRACGIDQPAPAAKPKKVSKAVKAKPTNWKKSR